MWTATIGHSDGENEFVSRGTIGDSQLDGVEMAPHEGSVAMMKGNVESAARAAALLRRWNDRLATATGFAQRCSESRVHQRRGVFEFTTGSDDHSLSVAVHVVAGELGDRIAGEFGREPLARFDQRLEIFHVSIGERIGNDGSRYDPSHGSGKFAADLDPLVLDDYLSSSNDDLVGCHRFTVVQSQRLG
jgi:hypothetical protein